MSKPVLGRQLGYWESGVAARHKYEVIYAKRRLGVHLKDEVHTASGWVGKSMSTIGGLGGPKSGG